MSKLVSPLPLQRLFTLNPDAPPRPEHVEDDGMKAVIESLYSHPDISRILNQLWRKDPYTYYHCHRVADMSQWLGHELGLSKQERAEIYLCGLLHDVGKIMTPDHILKKPGPLTLEEFRVMRLHPEDSANIVANIPDLNYLVEAIRGHHERIDGKGYPDQRVGDHIHIFSRVILVADTYDAMSTTRVYRRQLSLERIYDELNRCKGTQFDPAVADAFIAMHQRLENEKTAQKLAA